MSLWRPRSYATTAAVELFVTRVQSALPNFALTPGNAQTVGRICARLDGIPLALELAAGRARALPLDVIADRLDHRFHLLTSGNRTAVPRQQTLAATIAWSHDLLTDDERRLFRRLSVFAGGWTVDAAETICAPDDSAGGEVLDLLTRLIDKSMVVVQGGASGVERYRLLETLRQFGQERLAESGEADAIRDRHFAYYLALVKTAHTEVAVPRRRDGWLKRLDADNDNIRTALTWGSARDPRAALRLAVDLSWYWWYRRRHPGGRGLAGAAARQRSWRHAASSPRAGAHRLARPSTVTWSERSSLCPRPRHASMRSAIAAGRRTCYGRSHSCTSVRREWPTLGLLRVSICA